MPGRNFRPCGIALRMRGRNTGDSCIVEHFADRLAAAVKRTGNPVCVGLDPRAKNLPTGILADGEQSSKVVASAYANFCIDVIDVVAPLVPAVKPQAAFFEEIGPLGMAALAGVIDHARSRG